MEHHLTLPLTEEAVRALHVRDEVTISGTLYTARDRVHKLLCEKHPHIDLAGTLIYHCGPITQKDADGHYSIVAAGPTTSIRHEPYQATVIRDYGIRAIMGKGGMGAETRKALQECGAVYLQAVGGAAQLLANRITSVEAVEYLEFGEPEALWKITVQDFPAIVAMDSFGKSIYKQVENASSDIFKHIV